jgi:hypothetical protein
MGAGRLTAPKGVRGQVGMTESMNGDRSAYSTKRGQVGQLDCENVNSVTFIDSAPGVCA